MIQQPAIRARVVLLISGGNGGEQPDDIPLQRLHDPERRATTALRLKSLPQVLAINSDGSIGWRGGGSLPAGQTL